MEGLFPSLIALCGCLAAEGAPAAVAVATSAANFQPGLPPPGSIAAIFFAGLDVPPGINAAPGVPLPTTLAGVSVTIGGAPAPLFAVAGGAGYQQVNVQVPLEASSPAIVIQSAGQSLAATSAFRGSPGDFFANPDGSGIFQHAADYSLVTPQHPARPGEAIIAYLTGVAWPGSVATNTPAPLDRLVIVQQYSHAAGASVYTLLLNGVSVAPIFFGLAPGTIGVFQLNFVVPSTAGAAQQVVLQHYTCSGNFHGTCGFSNGNPATVWSAPVTLPVE